MIKHAEAAAMHSAAGTILQTEKDKALKIIENVKKLLEG